MNRLRVVLLAVLCWQASVPRAAAQKRVLSFSCSTFPMDIGEADLRMQFGVENVTTGQVPWGGAEGDSNEGTILFAMTPDARLEIFWRNRQGKRMPDWISVRGRQSRWRTPTGITLGTNLRTLERLNGRPFRLLGFGTDVSGTVMSWSGGQLQSQDSPQCRVRLRTAPPRETTQNGTALTFRELLGEREFSSGHPMMQTLDPSVYEMFLSYAR